MKYWLMFLSLLLITACSSPDLGPELAPDLKAQAVDPNDSILTYDYCYHPSQGEKICPILVYRHGYGNTFIDGIERQKVKELQSWLNRRGFNAGSVDGYFGWGTYNAVIRAQAAYGLSRDGIAGYCTWSSLFHGRRYNNCS